MAVALRGATFCCGVRYRCPLIGSLNPCNLPFQHVSSRGIASKLFVGAKIVMDRVSDRPKGFGFVTFASEDDAQNALERMNGKVLNGRVIFVDIAKAKPTSYAFPISRGPPDPPSSK
ncbi:hypothetical protein KFK09_003814 [Dendrobium nobile]|uniref:RRM domain-containing protein n=1 Tax=Dendrobium nobile TaxID=94219 RepID=A0A8T3C3L6_DENNO|nr:hypothetical protein KFK09_003814 [Dendrobium nobile]